MTNQTIWKLIQQYVTGNCSPQARHRIELWMDQDPENRNLVEEIQKIWDLSPNEEFEINVNEAWERFYLREMKSPENEQTRGNEVQRPSPRVMNLFRAAAIVLVSAFAGFFTHANMISKPDAETGQTGGFYVMQELTTEKGEKARITFSDGTQVILNSASSLQFPKEFNGSRREVHLEGEAFFDVAHDPEHPFIVYAQDTKVQVLGTEFNIRGWEGDSRVEVAVNDGKVSVKSTAEHLQQNEGVILTRGLISSIKPGEAPSLPEEVDIKSYLLWTSGGLHFDRTPFQQVVAGIERRFNVRISVAEDQLTEIPFTGTFQYAEIDEVLSVIAASMNLEFTRTGNEVEFY